MKKKKNPNSIGISIFGMKIRKNIKSMYQKYVMKKNILIAEERKGHHVLIKDLALYGGRKHFCRYCLQAFNT